MRLPFELDPQIIHHIIYSQAGSIGKAIIELIMNSIDANAGIVKLKITQEGFLCIDDGKGFSSKQDVLQYFGKFGTPHEFGDATYGRFRLGRGQIMAHAKTRWFSNNWRMDVDTQTMGYNYDLAELDEKINGCKIEGVWYEKLNSDEYMSILQEIRDLIKYTPIEIYLNDKIINRNPAKEKTEYWDYEDEYAYYKVRVEGAVSIYNQGVLVRHDPSCNWGVGGIIISKKAIGLNVSRTEILRKTCPIWKKIEKEFAKLAGKLSGNLYGNRKTEARREQMARKLLSADANILDIIEKEEVITILPGKRHISLCTFLRNAYYEFKSKFTIVEDVCDVPKGEIIAAQKIALVVHTQTLERFKCDNIADFKDCLERIVENIRKKEEYWRISSYEYFNVPEIISFSPIRDAFIENTKIVSEKMLDKETKRAWNALKWCLQQYAGMCLGERVYYSSWRLSREANKFNILLGESNSAEAWTDGKTYIAFNIEIVKKLKTDSLKTVSYMFSLLEHEISHEGDSISEGHDEAFYLRFHDINLKNAINRQTYMQLWLRKYTRSLTLEKNQPSGIAWNERRLLEKAGTGRIKKGLTPLNLEFSDEDLDSNKEVENTELIEFINNELTKVSGVIQEPNWDKVIERGIFEAKQRIKTYEKIAEEEEEYSLDISDEEFSEDMEKYYNEYLKEELEEIELDYEELYVEDEEGNYEECRLLQYGDLIYPGETMWTIERNAAAAGFTNIENYLNWRKEQ